MIPPRLFIIEGPDCCGKTTLANELARRLSAVYWHMTSSRALAAANEDYMMNALENVRCNLEAGYDVVLDRFWPSEHCYGPVLRSSDHNPAAVKRIFNAVTPLNPTYIFCSDKGGMESAVKRHATHLDPDHPYDDLKYATIYGNYLTLRIEMEQGLVGDSPDVRRYQFDGDLSGGPVIHDEKAIRNLLQYK